MDTLWLKTKLFFTTLLLGIGKMFENTHWTERIAFVIGIGFWVALLVCWILGIK